MFGNFNTPNPESTSKPTFCQWSMCSVAPHEQSEDTCGKWLCEDHVVMYLAPKFDAQLRDYLNSTEGQFAVFAAQREREANSDA